jgi:hypothetical protein
MTGAEHRSRRDDSTRRTYTAILAFCVAIHYTVIQEAAMPTRRRSRVFTISMPPELAASAEALAKQENRSMSELFREAFRIYERDSISRLIDETAAYAATRNPHGYTEEDVVRLVKEVRAEMRAEREAAKLARA